MPEGAEVKLSADALKSLVVGKNIVNAPIGETGRYKSERPFGFEQFCRDLTTQECRVQDVKTKGKFMWWEFSNGYYLFCTFGMSGQWKPWVPYAEPKHACIGFWFAERLFSEEGHWLGEPRQGVYFVDPRHFGTVKFIQDKQILLQKLNSLGWDPLQDRLEDYRERINNALQKSSKPIAQLLMDQSIFAGVGNYVKCEALYRSELSPWRLGKSFSNADIDILCRAIDNVMHESYNRQGATISTYKTVSGENGDFSNFFKVYGQKLDPHNNKIVKEATPDKRSTYWCPSIQK